MRLTYEQAREFIITHPELYLKPDRSGKGFICPLCGNGSGKDGDGLRENKKAQGRHFKCFRCGFYGDMIELIAQVNGCVGGSKEAFEIARKTYNIAVITPRGDAKMDYIENAQSNIELAREYIESRGLNYEVAKQCGLGFDKTEQAVVIPTNKDGYVLRYIQTTTAERYKNAPGMATGIFSPKGRPVVGNAIFIVEGAFDAISIIQCGYRAVALNSTANTSGFLDALKQRKDKLAGVKILIAMDKDKAGFECAQKLFSGLKETGIECQIVDISGPHKDANEALQADPSQFKTMLKAAVYPALAHKVGVLINEFHAFINDPEANSHKATGFRKFDIITGGGLAPRLYIIAAKPTLGKSTFCIQLMDQLAQSGSDIIYFTLEMPVEDIISKSIARETFTLNEAAALSETEVLNVEKRKANRELLEKAESRYLSYAADKINIVAGRYTAKDIQTFISDYIQLTKRKPIVFVDYLQILAPCEDVKTAGVREQVDYSLDVLAQVRAELKVPVVVISSINRASYRAESGPEMSALKESGTIEYSADCVIMLSLAADTNLDAEMRKDERKLMLKFVKNRGGRVGGTYELLYRPKYSYFREGNSLDKD